MPCLPPRAGPPPRRWRRKVETVATLAVRPDMGCPVIGGGDEKVAERVKSQGQDVACIADEKMPAVAMENNDRAVEQTAGARCRGGEIPVEYGNFRPASDEDRVIGGVMPTLEKHQRRVRSWCLKSKTERMLDSLYILITTTEKTHSFMERIEYQILTWPGRTIHSLGSHMEPMRALVWYSCADD